MGGLGKKGDFNMYHWIEDKNFLRNMRSLCSGIVNELVQNINNDSVMTVSAHMVGSGARNMETQNAHEPIDLDYNLNIDRRCMLIARTFKSSLLQRWSAHLWQNEMTSL